MSNRNNSMMELSDMIFQSWGGPEDEQTKHAELARESKNAIVEIGVLNGETTRILLENNPHVPVIGIDPLIPDSMNSSLLGSYERILENTKNFPNFTFIKDYSYSVAKTWNKKIGYLFIDGDHVYNAVKHDFESFFPFVEKGGYISIHDSALYRGGPIHWEGPSRLADEMINDSRVSYVNTIYCMTIFRKN